MGIDFKEILSAFVVLFAIIDITGSIPVIINLKERKGEIKAGRVSLVSFLTLSIFLFAGEGILNLFGVNVSSFAVAGSIVIFVLAAEMIFDVRIFKDESPAEASYIVPLVFPLIAGAGAFTTLLSLRAEYEIINIIVAVAFNMLVVFFVLKSTDKIEKFLGKGSIYVLRKFFGIILLAIAVKLFTSNLDPLLNQLSIAKNTEMIRHMLESGFIK
ncbi:MAG: MarC family protein [Bacteroidales bacterium]|nr:MarC family protein [Bacteroidales bacterium]